MKEKAQRALEYAQAVKDCTAMERRKLMALTDTLKNLQQNKEGSVNEETVNGEHGQFQYIDIA